MSTSFGKTAQHAWSEVRSLPCACQTCGAPHMHRIFPSSPKIRSSCMHRRVHGESKPSDSSRASIPRSRAAHMTQLICIARSLDAEACEAGSLHLVSTLKNRLQIADMHTEILAHAARQASRPLFLGLATSKISLLVHRSPLRRLGSFVLQDCPDPGCHANCETLELQMSEPQAS